MNKYCKHCGTSSNMLLFHCERCFYNGFSKESSERYNSENMFRKFYSFSKPTENRTKTKTNRQGIWVITPKGMKFDRHDGDLTFFVLPLDFKNPAGACGVFRIA